MHIEEVLSMRATLNIPDELVKEAQKVTGARTKTEAIVIALKEVVKKRRLDELIALAGKVDVDYNWEEEEKREVEAQRKRGKLLG
jgi:hypothetical protein